METYLGGDEIVMVCVSGPDAGKRFKVGANPTILGSSTTAHVVSDDLDVGERHVTFVLHNQRPSFQVEGTRDVFLDGQQVSRAKLRPGQQLRIGRSIWQIADEETAAEFMNWVGRMGGHLATAAGVSRIEGFSIRRMFSDVFKMRRDEEIEEYISVGGPTTTPSVGAVDSSWPRPWLFARCAVLSLLTYLAFSFAVGYWQNPHLIPGMIVVGSFAIPISVLIFFIEVNVPRNVSPYQIVKMFLVGGVTALVITMVLFGSISWALRIVPEQYQAMSAGPIEEVAKLCALVLVVRRLRYRWILNGLLFGATVGCGFAAFESAGYAFRQGMEALLSSESMIKAMRDSITIRGVLTLAGGHVAWTAIVAAALWRVRGQRQFRVSMLFDLRFLRVLGIAIALHMLWNSPWFHGFFYARYVVIGFVTWALVFAFVNEGLKQIRAAQSELEDSSREMMRTMFSEPAPAATPLVEEDDDGW